MMGRARNRVLTCLAVLALTGASVATTEPDRITTQFDEIARVDQRELDNLIAFLSETDETRGYTNYWVSYPLIFRSQEELVFYPALPYHQVCALSKATQLL